jgi:hypothetical protein
MTARVRVYLPIWNSLKSIYPDTLSLEVHPAHFERVLKAIRKEAYADTKFKSGLRSAGIKPVLCYRFYAAERTARFWIEKRIA